jgi:hypothetical protein
MSLKTEIKGLQMFFKDQKHMNMKENTIRERRKQ